MRVLVCGGRDYGNREHVHEVLTEIHDDEGPVTGLIHGCADGADAIASVWAWSTEGVCVYPFHADWKAHGKAAGPIRNQQMIDEGKPDLVIAFPGGRGTADMVRRAKGAGLRLIEAHAPRD